MVATLDADFKSLMKPGLIDAMAKALGWTDGQLAAYKAGLKESAKYCPECGRKFIEKED